MNGPEENEEPGKSPEPKEPSQSAENQTPQEDKVKKPSQEDQNKQPESVTEADIRTEEELKLNAKLRELESLSKKIKLTQLNASQMEILRKFNDDPHNFSQEKEAELQEALKAGGLLDTDEMKRYIALSKRMTPEDYARSADAMLKQDLNFTPDEIEIVRTYFDNPQTLLSMVSEKDEISQEDAMLYKGKILQIFNKLYDKIDKQPNRVFREEFSEFYEGRVFRQLKLKLEALRTSSELQRAKDVEFVPTPEGGLKKDNKKGNVSDFIDSIIKEVNIENRWRETYHDIWIYAKDAGSIEKWKDYISPLNVSEVSIFLSGSGGKMVELARTAFERYLIWDIAMNKNAVRPDLLAGLFDPTKQIQETPDLDNVRKYFLTLLEGRGIDPEKPENQWQIDRALSIARGISFINTLRVPEIIASAFPEQSLRGNFLYDIAAYFNPQWAWAWGRGLTPSGHQLMIPELRHIPVTFKPEKNFFKRVIGAAGRWVPEKIRAKTLDITEQLGMEIDRNWLDKQNDYGKLMRIFGIGGLHARAGWRFEGLKEFRKQIKEELGQTRVKELRDIEKGNWTEPKIEEYKKQLELDLGPLTPKVWETMLEDLLDEKWWYEEYLIKYVGAAARWYDDGLRAGNDMKRVLGIALLRNKRIPRFWNHLPDEDQKIMENEYSSGEKDMEVTAFGLTDFYSVISGLRELQYKGDTFYYLLKRSPLDFLLNMAQLVPELPGKDLGPNKNNSSFDYWFADDLSVLDSEKKPVFDLKNRETVRRFQERLRQKWGTEENYQHIRRIAQFWKDVRDSGITDEQLRDILSRAIEKVRAEKQTDMDQNDIKATTDDITEEDLINKLSEDEVNELSEEERKKLNADDKKELGKKALGNLSEDKKNKLKNSMATKLEENLRRLLYREESGEKGFVRYFNPIGDQHHKDLQEKDPGKGMIDQNSFFFRLARVWFKEEEVGVFPTTSEIDHEVIYRYIAKAGETMNKRLVGDIGSWQNMMKGITQLDGLLLNAATSHKLDEIYKLHGQLVELRGIAGEKYMHEAQYYVASLVARFFQEHYTSRLPFPLGTLAGFTNYRSVSLSKLSRAGTGAMTLNTDGLNAYFQQLVKMDAIAEKGPWSFSQISRSVGTEWPKMITTEVIPNVFSALMLFLLFRFISEAFKEAEGKKK